MTTKKVATVAPKIAELIVAPPTVEVFSVLKFEGDFEALPRPSFPYYIVAKNGFFMYKPTMLGPVFLKEDYYPEHFEEIPDEYKNGYFEFELPRIPATIMSQTLDFFRIVYEKIKAEAEVLLLFKLDSREYSLFIPYQVVSGGSVSSIYDQAHIPEGWEVVGTIHSHCNMNAFHSGIDEGDARNFNGLHITIGHVPQDNPSFDAMVMINKKKFQYRFAESVAEIENDLDILAAPESWYNDFVFTNAADILALNFPTLTREELDAFGAANRPTIWEAKVVEKKSWDGPSSGFSYLMTRYSDEFKRSYPKEEFESDTGYPAILKNEFFARELKIELARLFAMAAKHDLYLDARIVPLSDDDSQTLLLAPGDDVDDNILIQ